jgi:hypothetical protein
LTFVVSTDTGMALAVPTCHIARSSSVLLLVALLLVSCAGQYNASEQNCTGAQAVLWEDICT